ncbi:uncharacterized protein A4U43_C10F8750 [Asparagus officinalis]|uniref:Cytochrome P450 n=1 Tax=Asparagus officinalis TaxID=4686 RepID=A0A5P1E1F7_ASPOF|nr:uncharacterized protein A4U43_C10F8750 [Asparagus officinalis]
MNYLKAVTKEILRLHPPAPLLIPRESMETCQILSYKIPARTRVIINAWAIGRDPELWKEPDKFKTERFLSSNVDFRGRDFHFIPFGAGRRICPGMQAAISTLEVTLANLVHRFDWELPEGMEIKGLDMSEAPGLTTHRKEILYLAAKPVFTL